MNNRSITFIMDGNFIFFNNGVYSPHMHYQAFASRYSKYFKNVNIYARAFEKEQPVGSLVAQNNVEFIRAPTTRGLKSYILNIFNILNSVKHQVNQADILMLRFPGNLSIIAMIFCLIYKKKFCVEVVAEPKDYFTKENGFGKFSILFRWVHCSSTKYAVKRAQIVRYVTTKYLQNSYPADNSKTFGFTDVYLGNLGNHRKVIDPLCISNRIINVGMMHNDSKGHIQLIEACSILKKKGLEVYIEFVGDGIRRPYYESLVSQLDIQGLVKFNGVVSGGDPLIEKLLNADLFILPSTQEGMPRSLLEAMYLHLPCIATTVGGIPEILPEEALIISNDSHILAEKLEYFLFNAENLLKLQQFSITSIQKLNEDVLKKMYDEYNHVLNHKG